MRDEWPLPALESSAKALAGCCPGMWKRLCSSRLCQPLPWEEPSWTTHCSALLTAASTFLGKWQWNQAWLQASVHRWRAGNPSWHFSHVQQQMQDYLKYYFGSSALNTTLMSTQVFFGYRTWVNRVQSRFCQFFCFQFYAKIHWFRATKDHFYFKCEVFLQCYLSFPF